MHLLKPESKSQFFRSAFALRLTRDKRPAGQRTYCEKQEIRHVPKISFVAIAYLQSCAVAKGNMTR